MTARDLIELRVVRANPDAVVDDQVDWRRILELLRREQMERGSATVAVKANDR